MKRQCRKKLGFMFRLFLTNIWNSVGFGTNWQGRTIRNDSEEHAHELD
jgi:hypothetical protein